eukprot:362529-Chlamydomonas_euryale.AAC.6
MLCSTTQSMVCQCAISMCKRAVSMRKLRPINVQACRLKVQAAPDRGAPSACEMTCMLWGGKEYGEAKNSVCGM